MKILGIESSCDESAAALFDSERGIVFELVDSQIDLHALYGGVVPDLASTEHLKKLPPLLAQVAEHVDVSETDAIAVTNGPGLPNCLAIGVSCASALALALRKPLYGVNHLRGHALSPFIPIHEKDPENFADNLKGLLPHLGLVASGGNSILFEMDESLKMRLIAETVDDAAGEALDKGAKLLGMPYPGAPLLEKAAAGGNERAIDFPRGQNRKISEDPNFSFSGLKTSLRYFLDKLSAEEIAASKADICASYQYAVVEQLKRRTEYFLRRKKYASLGLSGGVSNNGKLRAAFENIAKKAGAKMLLAKRKHCSDNAAMIAFAAFMQPNGLEKPEGATLKINPSRPMCNTSL